MVKTFGRLTLLLLFLSTGMTAYVQGAEKGFEPPPTLKAGAVLPGELLQGKRYRIEETVPTDGFLMKFTIVSDFGTFIARSPGMAETRIREIDALDRLEKVSKSDAFKAGLKAAGREFGKQVGQLIENPEETIKGVPEGVGRFFERVGRGAKTGYQKLGDMKEQEKQPVPPPAGPGARLPGEPEATGAKGGKVTVEEATLRMAGKVTADAFGYDDQRRRIARELGVDPYSTNPVLTQRLDDIASAAFAGGLGISAFKAVVPAGMVISTGTALSDWVWDMAPGDLKVQNERSLLAMGVAQDQVDRLLRQPQFTLTLQTRLVKALERLKQTAGRPGIMPVATTVLSFDQARFVVEALEMLALYHEKIAPIKALEKEVPFAGRTGAGVLVVAGPVDLLAWTEKINRFAARPDLKAKQKILWLRGEATPRARQELPRLGWTVKEKSGK
ncbi:MAG: hypothetical protein HY892_00450 [Deltaproteobacteria bacterium]|nr:hypothetical protein [Deltaproteobacteria bacterium]